MKIAQIAPLYEAVPPRLYGGTERVVAYLADALVALGHDVTLFASGDSSTRAVLQPMRACAIRLDPAPQKSDLAAHLAMLHEVRARAHEFDIVHSHIDLMHYPFFADSAARVVTTLHGRLDIPDLVDAYRRWPQFALVSISLAQRRPLPHLDWIGMVHHGVPADLLVPGPGAGGYVAFVGRISPEKRVDRAIRIARRLGVPLRIAAKVDDADRRYFDTQIAPLLQGGGVEFLGEVDTAGKQALLGDALALLFPIDWPEPFGLVMIEAMACGTPVIAWNCGSVPELIEPGVSGFVVAHEDEAVAAFHQVAALDRRAVRAAFDRRFSATRMARGYLEVYERVLARSRNEARAHPQGRGARLVDPPRRREVGRLPEARPAEPRLPDHRAIDSRARDARGEDAPTSRPAPRAGVLPEL
jgi:glycosyltransferase involved in cell wall biosynthesis